MIQLWPFQDRLISDLRERLLAGYRAPLLVSPTGSGKTVVFAYLSGRLAASGMRCLILAHRKELLDQISNTLTEFKVTHGRIAPNYPYNSFPKVQVASVFSIPRKLKYLKVPDYIIIDESHHAIRESTWGKVMTHYRAINPKLRVIGVTATPQRLSGEGLGDMFDTLIMGPTVADLIRDGYLSPYKMFAPPIAVDMSGVHRRMGDFIKSEAAAAMDKPSIMGDAIAHYKKHLNGAPTVGFCVSVEHAYHVAENYKANGFQAACIEGKLPEAERNQIVKDFAAGRLNYMASCDLISEGFDVKGMVGCQNLRPTESLAMALQQWGRVLRYVPGKTAIILDHVGNSSRHGLPDMDREWSLEGSKAQKKKSDPDLIAIKQCDKCGAINARIAKECSECGQAFTVKSRQVDEVEGDLQEVDPELVKQNFKAARASAKDLEALVQIGRMKGMKNPEGWAGHVLSAQAKKQMEAGHGAR